ncbi:hypothetical protein TRFO_17274 [Tritrichomonas foetus]|uniref:Uncharacterized protein n=1 Tax=Tritrichomonas foetus TaxID=1144522 RepID=A0A1J4KSM5_9EUKA|nr:hypothetical protein TRFO_17274 [Tritrichomonas foetus]|eukprot:OHT12804.1 hypothetical protein TRFO_17274 [Tritrichomonas foetus]
MLNYKNRANLKKGTETRHHYHDISADKEEEENEYEKELFQYIQEFHKMTDFDQSMFQLLLEMSEICNSEVLIELSKLNIFNLALSFVSNDSSYVSDFLTIISDVSKLENSGIIFTPDLLGFLNSLIKPAISDDDLDCLANIISNFATSGPQIASLITQYGTINKMIDHFNFKITGKIEQDFHPFYSSILELFANLLDIPNFQPVNQIDIIIEIAFKYVAIENEDILMSCLHILTNASSEFNFPRFLPHFNKQINFIQNLLDFIDSEEEEVYSEAFNILINISQFSPYFLKKKIFDDYKNDIMMNLPTSIQKNQQNYSNVMRFIGNMIETKQDIVEKLQEKGIVDPSHTNMNDFSDYRTPILDFFKEFIYFILQSFNDIIEGSPETEVFNTDDKSTMAWLFSVVTETGDSEFKEKFIQDKRFIPNICFLFHIEPEIDFDILCGLYNLLRFASVRGNEMVKYVIGLISESISEEELRILFDDNEEIEDANYLEKLDDVLDFYAIIKDNE